MNIQEQIFNETQVKVPEEFIQEYASVNDNISSNDVLDAYAMETIGMHWPNETDTDDYKLEFYKKWKSI